MASTPTAVATPAQVAPPTTTPVLQAFQIVERVADLVDETVADLRVHLPGARRVSGTHDGRWVRGLHFGGRYQGGEAVDPRGAAFTRLEIEIRADERAVELGSRATVRDRDLPSDRCRCERAAGDAAALDDARRFIEEQALAFAEAWFRRG